MALWELHLLFKQHLPVLMGQVLEERQRVRPFDEVYQFRFRNFAYVVAICELRRRRFGVLNKA